MKELITSSETGQRTSNSMNKKSSTKNIYSVYKEFTNFETARNQKMIGEDHEAI